MKLRRRNQSSDGNDRGAIAVETAVAGMLLVMMFFGVLEFGSMLRTRTVLTDASREGARVVAALPREPNFQNHALAAINGVIANHRGQPIDVVTIYRADPNTGLPLTDGVLDCTVDCWRYWAQPDGSLAQDGTASWDAADQVACGGLADTDYVGVYIGGHHEWVTGLFGTRSDFTETSMMRLEPLPIGTPCRP